ncbi:MAG: response regulator transcription factor [Taibaiella sp.]|nr:response regulator transcription factor [Taibaiella sp.]
MIRVAVIDDEVKSRTNLIQLLQRFCPDVTIVLEAGSITEGLPALVAVRPDLLILDIEMPGGTGFDLLDHFHQHFFEIIFVTAHSEHALQAIKAGALDYLLKPISIEELQSAIEKARKRISEKNTETNIRQLIEILDTKKNHYHKIAVPSYKGQTFIAPADIVSMEAEGRYTRIRLLNAAPIVSSSNLKEYEDMLSPEQFMRVHHAYIINMEHVHYYNKEDGGTIIMTDGSEIILSKRKKKDFLDRFS